MNHFLQSIAYFTYLLIADTTVVSYFGAGALILFYPTYKLISSTNHMHKGYNAGKLLIKPVNAVENLPLIRILRMEESESKNFSDTVKQVYEIVFKTKK